MLLKHLIFSAIFMMALHSNATELPQNIRITIKDRMDVPAPTIRVKSIFDFEKILSLRFRPDPKYVPSPQLIAMVADNNMVDASGSAIKSGFDIDKQNDLVIGYSGGSAEIVKSQRTLKGIKVISNFRDQNSHLITPPTKKIAIYDTGGTKQCFDHEQQQVEAQNPMAFAILIDKSYSMASHMYKLKHAAKTLLKSLPKGSLCAVAEFNHSWKFESDTYLPCAQSGASINTIRASGGTNILEPMMAAYTDLNNGNFKGYQKAVIVVTDGYEVSNKISKSDLLKAKGDITTFAYFIGSSYSKDSLHALADYFLTPQNKDISGFLSSTFKTISKAYKTQQVLNVKSSCPTQKGTGS